MMHPMPTDPKKCPVCGKPNALGEICPYCRGRTAGGNRLQRSAWMLTGAMTIVLVMLFFWANRLDPRTPSPPVVGSGPDVLGVLDPDGGVIPGSPVPVTFGQESCVPWHVSASSPPPAAASRYLILTSKVVDPFGLYLTGFSAACGDQHTALIAEKLKDGELKTTTERIRPAAIVTIGMPAWQKARAEVPELPTLFAAIPNPVEAILARLDQAGSVGISPWIPADAIARHLQKVLPRQKPWALLHPIGRLAAMGEQLRQKLAADGVAAVRLEIGATDLDALLVRAATEAGAWVVLSDRKIIDAATFNRIQVAAERNQIPVGVADEELVREGALIGVGTDSHRLGQQLCHLAGALERKDLPAGSHVFCPETSFAVIHQTVAEKLGYLIDPTAVRQMKLYKWH